MSWYQVTLSRDDISAAKHFGLTAAFADLFAGVGTPRNAGLFVAKDHSAAYVYYLSVGDSEVLERLALTWGGIKCPAPSRSSVDLVAAHTGAESVPFGQER